MLKHFKSRFSSGEPNESPSKAKINIEFFQLLKTYLRKQGAKLYLKFPETITLNAPNCDSVLFFSDEEGNLICRESITNEYVRRFIKRCYFFFKPPYPKIILKVNKSNFSDCCHGMPSLTECYSIWKNRESTPSYFALQRFIIPQTEESFKIRVFYSIQKNSMLYRIIRKREGYISPIPGKQLVLKNKSSVVQLENIAYDKYFVRNGEEGADYDCELRNGLIQEMMKSLKKVIETVGSADGSFALLELFADFIQDSAGVWYFLNVVNYKLEFIVNKKTKNLTQKGRRKASSSVSLQKEAKKSLNVSQNSGTFTLQDSLLSQVMQDLVDDSEKGRNKKQLLYRRAYHLK